MRPTAASATAALTLLLAGCALSHPDEQAARDTTAGLAALTHLRGLAAAHDKTAGAGAPDSGRRPTDDINPLGEASTGDGAGPAAAAAAKVIVLLEAEGLHVLDLDTEAAHLEPGLAIIIVSVLHGTGRGYPHDSRYKVTVTDDGGWQAVTVEAAT